MASTATATDSYPSPVTPRDSDSEGSRAIDSMAGQKRTASEMEGHQDQQGRTTQTARKAARIEAPQTDKHTEPEASAKSEPQETIEAESKVDTTFTVECPVWPDTKSYKGRVSRRENLYTTRDAPSPDLTHLAIDYAVKPGSQWSKLNIYKNAKFKDPVEVTYSAGQIIYINRHYPVPLAPPADASEDEKLAYDRENLWVGLIADFRAVTQEKVYVRLFWLYWPEELPMGRQAYHGKQELVLSNHVDVVEAQSIACHTNISHWDENDDSNKVILSERYWRQTYNLSKMVTAPRHALSRLRRFCICGGYDNPGRDMYQCHQTGCGMWNHQACLISNFEERAWESFKKGRLTHEVVAEPKTVGQKVADAVGHIVGKSLGKTEIKGEETGVKDEAHSDHPSMSSGKAKLPAPGKRPWADKLVGTVTRFITSADEVTHRATIKQLVPASNSKPRASFSPKTWNMELKCLRCQHSLN